ncbi:tyrosine-type recombinase/integrase [Alphaproteobacteria bacterium]|nr:tyrosine-type recombinase/integrase [Alphaproteobacteria bacterium]
MGYNNSDKYVTCSNGIYYFIRRVPTDLSDQYRSNKIKLSLRTRNSSKANRCARSITQRLDDYWLGLRLQKLDIPAINLLRTGSNSTNNEFTLTDALDLYLKLKGIDKDKTFIRTANRNTEYVTQVLGNKSVTAYSSSEAAQFRDWLIDKGMGKSTVKRVFSSIRSIINLAIKEHGLDGNNGFLGTFIPDGLRETTRKPIPVDVIKDIQQTCKEIDDDLRWLIALLSDTGMRLGEAVGLLKSDIILDTDPPHLNLIPHPWRRLKTTGSERKIPLVGASLWSARRAKQSNPTNQFAFPRYCNEQSHNSNSASAALNKWLRNHAPEGCVVHSFRHSMRDRLRAVECPKEIIDQIGGWSSSDVGESYGEGFQLSNVRNWMNKLCLSIS